MNNTKKGFTLIELLVVIAIIGILSTFAVVSLQSARSRARDAKRISDVRQIMTALELYFSDASQYPASTSVSNSLYYGDNIYMAVFPESPTPADGDCSGVNDYVYYETDNYSSYNISFCLGGNVGNVSSGLKCATPAGVLNVDCYPAD